MFEQILDLAAVICVFLAAVLSVAAGIGLLRFPDALSRLHAATKPQIFGLLLVIAAIALDQRSIPFYVMKSNGGVLSADEVVHQPITTVLSGPAAGALGAALIGKVAMPIPPPLSHWQATPATQSGWRIASSSASRLPPDAP